ncbi:MAG: flagellar motor protein MotB [Holosporaceae bacterium]
MADKNIAPIIVIKKKKKGAHDAHSSAWKIALADFMTALMCFFLVMWLTTILNTDTQKDVSRFFSASGIDETEVGIGGILGGTTITVDGPLTQMSAEFSMTPPMGAAEKTDSELLGPYAEADGKQADEASEDKAAGKGAVSPLLRQIIQDIEDKAQKVVQEGTPPSSIDELLAQGQGAPKMIEVTATKEELRIDLLDTYNHPMFKVGSAHLLEHAKKIMSYVAKKIKPLHKDVTIIGHTDDLRYHSAHYTNWELSSDRANATRRYLQSVAPDLKIKAVTGRAATDLYNPQNPQASTNRRISLVVSYDKEKAAKAQDSPTSSQSQTAFNDPVGGLIAGDHTQKRAEKSSEAASEKNAPHKTRRAHAKGRASKKNEHYAEKYII